MEELEKPRRTAQERHNWKLYWFSIHYGRKTPILDKKVAHPNRGKETST